MAGVFDFLHIKRRTAGSSNELSFDVLDAASAELDSAKKRSSSRSSRVSAGPKPSQGNYHGVAGTSTLSAVPEVERRKKARRAHSIRMGVVATVVVVALLCAGGYFGYRFYEDRMDFTGRLNMLVSDLVQVDQTLVTIDTLMKDPMSSLENDKRVQASSSIPTAEEDLLNIINRSEEMLNDSSLGGDVEVLSEVIAAARARQEMLAAASSAFEASEKINKEVSRATAAWNDVVKADQKAREAAIQANNASTEEATVASKDLTEEACNQMQGVLRELAQIQSEVPGSDFSAQKTYLETRVQALEFAITTSESLLANDRAGAIAANDSYNQKDREAARLASALPPAIGDQIEKLYEDEMAHLVAAYQTARTHVTTADSDLRSKLG